MSENITNPKPSHSRIKWILENILSLLLAFLIVFMIRSSILEAFKIPSGSMIPTLLVGDHIFVNKFAYGLKIPFSDLLTDHPVYLIKRDLPKRGDVIVFLFPRDENFFYIKRVIGIPGDKIEIKNKSLFVNQKLIPRTMVVGAAAEKTFRALGDSKYTSTNLDLYQESFEQGDHVIMFNKNSSIGESYGPVTVPPENLFVMGDNRDFSNDSRFWGFVPMRNVKGKAFVVWLSLWVNLTDSQFIFRPDRIGTVVH